MLSFLDRHLCLPGTFQSVAFFAACFSVTEIFFAVAKYHQIPNLFGSPGPCAGLFHIRMEFMRRKLQLADDWNAARVFYYYYESSYVDDNSDTFPSPSRFQYVCDGACKRTIPLGPPIFECDECRQYFCSKCASHHAHSLRRHWREWLVGAGERVLYINFSAHNVDKYFEERARYFSTQATLFGEELLCYSFGGFVPLLFGGEIK